MNKRDPLDAFRPDMLTNSSNSKSLSPIQKLDVIMQSGLQFRFFNRPVQDDYLWDIKCFWTHEDVCTSEGFDSCEECIDDCLNYLRDYDLKIKLDKIDRNIKIDDNDSSAMNIFIWLYLAYNY